MAAETQADKSAGLRAGLSAPAPPAGRETLGLKGRSSEDPPQQTGQAVAPSAPAARSVTPPGSSASAAGASVPEADTTPAVAQRATPQTGAPSPPEGGGMAVSLPPACVAYLQGYHPGVRPEPAPGG